MNNLMSYLPDTGVEVLVAATAVVVFVTSAYCIRMIGLALRAKMRAQFLLQETLVKDVELQRALASLVNPKLTIEEQERMCREIESRIAQLSVQDRKFVEEGLRQQNRVGAQRYIRELVGA
jgi:hypothetical protein